MSAASRDFVSGRAWRGVLQSQRLPSALVAMRASHARQREAGFPPHVAIGIKAIACELPAKLEVPTAWSTSMMSSAGSSPPSAATRRPSGHSNGSSLPRTFATSCWELKGTDLCLRLGGQWQPPEYVRELMGQTTKVGNSRTSRATGVVAIDHPLSGCRFASRAVWTHEEPHPKESCSSA